MNIAAWGIGVISLNWLQQSYCFLENFIYEQEMDVPQVGGSEEAFLASKPLFLSMGKSAIYCGKAGSGSVSYILEISTSNFPMLYSWISFL